MWLCFPAKGKAFTFHRLGWADMGQELRLGVDMEKVESFYKTEHEEFGALRGRV